MDRASPREPVVRTLHLATLVAFGVSQPLFDLLAGHPEVLVAHGVGGFDLVALAIGIGWGIPVFVAGAVAGGDRAWPRVGPWLRGSAFAVLTALVALPALRERPGGAAALASALAIGAGCAFAYTRAALVRRFVTVASMGLLVFPVLFLWRASGATVDGEGRLAEAIAFESGAPIVVIVFDALPLSSLLDERGEIDAVRHPHFAALAARSHWFVETTAVAERTTYALPAILTGRFPRARLPASSEAYPENLFTWIGSQRGVHAIEPFTALCPPSLCDDPVAGTGQERWSALASDLAVIYLHRITPQPYAEGLPDVTQTWRDFARDRDSIRRRRADASWVVDRFVEGFAREPVARLHFLHLNLPHRPFRYLPGGAEYGPIGPLAAAHGARKGVWRDDAWPVSQALQRHLLQTGYADALLGRVLARLRDAGVYDDAFVVVTADHGERFRPGTSARQIGRRNTEPGEGDILRVPFFLKEPGQQSGVVHTGVVEAVDVAPTLIAALGGRAPVSIEGRDALEASAPARSGRVVWVSLPDGSRVPLRRPAQVELGEPVLQRLGAPFASRGRSDDLFAIGPHTELLGVATERLPEVADADASVRIADVGAYDDVRPDGEFVPAHVAGEIERASGAAGEEPLELALALDGVIRAVTRSYVTPAGAERFAAMLPPDAFVAGRNELAVFAVDRSEEGLRLRRLAGSAAASRAVAVDTGGQLAFVYTAGRVLPMDRDRVEGGVEASGAYLSGRAVDATSGRAADSLWLLDAGRVLYAHPLGSAEPAGDRPGLSRFHFAIPYGRLAGGAGSLRFVALGADGATELRLEGAEPAARASFDPARLESRDGREGVRLDVQTWLPLAPDAVELVVPAGADQLTLRGRLEADGRAQWGRVLGFVDGRLETSGETLACPDPEAGRAGGASCFELSWAGSGSDGRPPGAVRLVLATASGGLHPIESRR